MSQTLRLVYSKSEKETALSQVKCRMLSVGLPPSPNDWNQKMAALRVQRPGAAKVVERLIDDLLAGHH